MECRSGCLRILCARLILAHKKDLRDGSSAVMGWKRQQTREAGHAFVAPGHDRPRFMAVRGESADTFS